MNDLTYQRCFNHAEREAVARCLACGQYFCRECVTEHEDRVICAACLRKVARVPFLRRRGFAAVLRGGQGLLGLLAAWFFFYLVGEQLLALPARFHEGTLWLVPWRDRHAGAFRIRGADASSPNRRHHHEIRGPEPSPPRFARHLDFPLISQ